LAKHKEAIRAIDDYSFDENKKHILKLIEKYDYKLEDFDKLFINYVSTTGDSFNDELNYLVISDQLDDVMEKKFEQKEYLDFIKAISDKKRVKIIKLLSHGKYCNSDLAKKLELTPATMSYHLNKLMQLNILDIEKGAYNKLFYTLDKNKLKTKFDQSFEHITS
jgi:DNA-binding transcriptional ArsR family regulator